VTLSTRKPVCPSLITSRQEPRSIAMAGTPAALASTRTSPNRSGMVFRCSRARARKRVQREIDAVVDGRQVIQPFCRRVRIFRRNQLNAMRAVCDRSRAGKFLVGAHRPLTSPELKHQIH
jgi:hypothetical protein